MDKMALRARLLSLEAAEFENTQAAYADFVASAKLDRGEPFDEDAAGQAERARFLAEQLECPLHSHQAKLDLLRRIDFGPKTSVAPGAVVTLGGRDFVIAVATAPFSCEGQTLVGMSTEAPLYLALEGLQAGETFEFRGRSQRIEAVA